MAIQHRRGNAIKFDKNKLLPGELAVILDTRRVYACFKAGDIKELGAFEDITAYFESENKALQKAFTDKINQLGTNNTTATTLIKNLTAVYELIKGTQVGNLAAEIDGLKSSKAPTSHASANQTYGVASAGKYGHAMAGSSTPKPPGTADVGTDNGKYAREDHVHAKQTSVTGNAGTATKLKTARKIGVSGVTGEAQSFNGDKDITIKITEVPASLLTGVKNVDVPLTVANGFIKQDKYTNKVTYIPLFKIVIINFALLGTIPANSTTKVASIPKEYAPSALVVTTGATGDVDTGHVQCEVTTGGAINVYSKNGFSAGGRMRSCLVYVLA